MKTNDPIERRQKDHGPIEDDQREAMNALAAGIDQLFNGTKTGNDRTICFVLLTARFGDVKDGRVNYISNGERDDCVSMLKEITARFEGRYVEGEGHA